MEDQDLGGDDLKFVSYTILFTKRDHEATLQPERQDVVDYPTDGVGFAGLKVAEFMARLRAEGIEKPPGWEERNYPTEGEGRVKDIPESDRKHIAFVYRVEQRTSRQTAEYDREKIDVLREIKEDLREKL